MNRDKNSQMAGFSLIEVLLVLIITSTLLFLGVNYMQQKTAAERIDRTVMQLQQVLNAGLAYYVEKKDWPATPQAWTSTSVLQNAGYLPPGTINSPWGISPNAPAPGETPQPGQHPSSYSLGVDAPRKRFSVLVYIGKGIQGMTNARIIAGKLPSAQACNRYDTETGNCVIACDSAAITNCFVAASVPVPGQNLNNATGVNYVGIMHSGACVKAPACPNSSMEPMIMVVPSSVIGITEAPTGTCTPTNLTGCNITSYPITAYVGYSTALTAPLAAGGKVSPTGCGNTTPQDCISDSNNTAITANAGDRYWRVCLRIDTSNGRVSPTTNQWGQLSGTMLVFTRCSPTTENSKNSGFNVYQ